ncbi:MAG: hypothetical protein D3914_07815 [Candidatus Electrothrix sp. LOE2]|nr:hypothetical protein [Candidatus Electrothrix sp. LOE2]
MLFLRIPYRLIQPIILFRLSGIGNLILAFLPVFSSPEESRYLAEQGVLCYPLLILFRGCSDASPSKKIYLRT